jgi:hypothetical protein
VLKVWDAVSFVELVSQSTVNFTSLAWNSEDVIAIGSSERIERFKFSGSSLVYINSITACILPDGSFSSFFFASCFSFLQSATGIICSQLCISSSSFVCLERERHRYIRLLQKPQYLSS